MVILGIDPGIALMGYGVLTFYDNSLSLKECGTIVTQAGVALPYRLKIIYENVCAIIAKHSPACIAFEELFAGRNTKTVMQVAQARGVAMAAAFSSGAQLFEYTPMQIKQAITGYGHADKNQVQQMVRVLLNLQKVITPDDAADAVACAICHANSSRFADEFRIK